MIAEIEKKAFEKVRWACRRGMLECDLFLVPFFEECYAKLSADEQQVFRTILEAPDPQLIEWLLGHEQPGSPESLALIKKIRAHSKQV